MDKAMWAYQLCRSYLEAVNKKDLHAVQQLFVPQGSITCPILGTTGVDDFHTKLFGQSRKAIARLIKVFDEAGGRRSTGLMFNYTWVLPQGAVVTFDGFTQFEFDEECKKIARVTIIYDATELKRHLNAAQLDNASYI